MPFFRCPGKPFGSPVTPIPNENFCDWLFSRFPGNKTSLFNYRTEPVFVTLQNVIADSINMVLHTIVVACDGAALRNPHGPGGWAWFASHKYWAAGGAEQASNNVMELTAVLQFLEATTTLAPETPIKIVVDSTYVRDSVTKWVHGWERNGWKTKTGDPVKNKDLIKPIVQHLRARPGIQIEWVRGHAGHPLNEMADEKANNAAHSIRTGTNIDTGPGWTRTLTTLPHYNWETRTDDTFKGTTVRAAGRVSGTGKQGWWYWDSDHHPECGAAGIRPFTTPTEAALFAVLSAVRTIPPHTPITLAVPADTAILFTPNPEANPNETALLKEIASRIPQRIDNGWRIITRTTKIVPNLIRERTLNGYGPVWVESPADTEQ